MYIMKHSNIVLSQKHLAVTGTIAAFFIVIFTSISAVPPALTERISWNEAVKLKTAYLGYRPMMVEYRDAAGKIVRAPLQGFQMDARMIDEVINRNQNAPGGDSKADNMMIYFGIDGFSGSGATAIPNYRIIVVGEKGGKLMKNPVASDVAQSSVMDKADPCPPNCPN